MRVASNLLYQQTMLAIQTQQQRLTKLQSQMASSVRVQTASDDPVAAGQLLTLQKSLADVTQWQSNVTSLQSRLGIEDSTMGSVYDSLTQIQSYALQANNATLSDSDRQALAQQIQAQFKQLIAFSNTQDSNGRYIFGGTQDGGTPFVQASGGGVSYNGNSSFSFLAVGPSSQIASSDPGDSVFMNIKSGNGIIDAAGSSANTGTAYVSNAQVTDSTQYDGGSYSISINGGQYQVTDSGGAVVSSGTYTADSAVQFRGLSVTLSGTAADGDTFSITPAKSQDLFTTIQNLATAVVAAGSTTTAAQRAQGQTNLYQALQSLQTAMGHVSEIRSGVGAREATLDDNTSRLQDLSAQYQKTVSGYQDLDYASASTQFSQTQLVLQAAEQSYVSIQGLSLFNYLR